MSPHKVRSAEFQVHYLGSSADLGALRRSMEAKGVVSRSRLTPGVAAVVADATVPLDHPTLVTAGELGIPVYNPAQAIDRLLAAPVPRQRAVPLPVASTPLITVTVLVLIGALALLGFTGALANSNTPTPTTVQQVIEQQR
ncbi:MAG: hypothetical protein ACRDSN_20530 [Pseudonocardiaceae bacterium]